MVLRMGGAQLPAYVLESEPVVIMQGDILRALEWRGIDRELEDWLKRRSADGA